MQNPKVRYIGFYAGTSVSSAIYEDYYKKDFIIPQLTI